MQQMPVIKPMTIAEYLAYYGEEIKRDNDKRDGSKRTVRLTERGAERKKGIRHDDGYVECRSAESP